MSTAYAFIHLSDIHFGQEEGGRLIWHDDVKRQLVRDVEGIAANRLARGAAPIQGLMITGDVAYAGKEHEYEKASAWLKDLTRAARCNETEILVVPGNHDIDRARINMGTRLMLRMVAEGGEDALDQCLASEGDREILYERLMAYRLFAYGYGCELSQEGGRAAEKPYELGPGRHLICSGLNSALICGEEDVEGKLLLGARQHVFHEEDGVAYVVLTHHPLNWLSDKEQTANYLRNRTSVLLSGHEHEPRIHVEKIDGEPRFLTVAAGATIPPKADGRYNFTYNVLEFALNGRGDGLQVTVEPRTWNKERVRFEADATRFDDGSATRTFAIDCPSFRRIRPFSEEPEAELKEATGAGTPAEAAEEMTQAPYVFAQLRLRFFRDLDALERLTILYELEALPRSVTSAPSLTAERIALERLNQAEKLAALAQAIERQLGDRGSKKR